MKCAKCGHDVRPDAPECPYCAAHGADELPENGFPAPEPRENGDRTICPKCGSHQIYAVTRGYDPGCGCLGLLLFSWIGLLLGLLGAGQVDMVCARCGHRWPAGGRRAGGIGCGALLLIVLLVILLLRILG